ncbi:flavin reductase like domain-containing protein [Podospora appendiculata]|uniref:Flavin reductase like domain-containing protein n=1 Tax=Podospora appendiculata TaxID=314037 RepID=A0AAE0X5S2_9PEZI|nr:flavin reductase like domain-containing protein [Podospora appendiculata]
MSRSRRVLGLSAEHACLLLRNGHGYGHSTVRSAMRCLTTVAAQQPSCQGLAGRYTANPLSRRSFQTTCTRPRSRAWAISAPREPSIHPDASAEHADTPLSQQVRGLMRLLTHSVVVCTSTLPGSAAHPPIPRAMTMSSFTSLALRPTPVVSFNIATPSRTFDAVAASRCFNVHILAADVSGAKIADWLTRGNADGPRLWEGLADECHCEVEMGSGQADQPPPPPMVHGPGVLYVLRCRLLDEPSQGLVRVRDHVIVLGEVLEIVESGAKSRHGSEEARDRRFGLMYTDRTYRQLGNCMVSTKVSVKTDVEETTSTIGSDRRHRGPTT